MIKEEAAGGLAGGSTAPVPKNTISGGDIATTKGKVMKSLIRRVTKRKKKKET